jgi:copper chaperone CopZ
MKTEKIIIANLKCGGCATTIKNDLLKLNGVNEVSVDIENDAVNVNYNDDVDRKIIIDKLHSLGYPEATAENGLLLQIKSYASCMVGRINNL